MDLTAWMPRRRKLSKGRQAPEIPKECFMIINHNLSAMFADRSLKTTQVFLDKNMEKLSSGLRINRA